MSCVLLGLCGGYFFDLNNVTNENIKKQNTPSPILEPMTSWKAYENPEIGFLLKYPLEWNITTNSQKYNKEQMEYTVATFDLPKNEKNTVILEFFNNSQNLSFEELDKKLAGPAGFSPALSLKDNIHLLSTNGITTYYQPTCILDGPEIFCEGYILVYEDKVFRFRNFSKQYQRQTFEYILSSFKFNDENLKQQIKLEEKKINGYKIFQTIDIPSFSGELNVFIPNSENTKYIHFSLSPYNKKTPFKKQSEISTIFTQILSTFKFENTIKTAMQKYTSTRCNFSIEYPSGWQAKDAEILKGTNDGDYNYGCIVIQAPDYTETIDIQGGFYMYFTKTKKDVTHKAIPINSLDEYITTNEIIGNQRVAVKNKIEKTYGNLTGKQFDPQIGAVELTVFIFEKDNYIYTISWPKIYTGSFKDTIPQILSTFKFFGEKSKIIDNSYLACGCGCCVRDNYKPQEICIDRSKGETLEKIKELDIKGKNDPQCSLVGCSPGILYKYCN